MHLTWTPNASASALHASQAICVYGDKLADGRVAESIGKYALQLGDWIETAAPFDTARFWSLLIGHSATIASNMELAQLVVRKAAVRIDNKSAASRLSGFISDIEAAYNQLFPKFQEQLPLRARPIQEHWLGFGPGLLAHLGRLTQKDLLVPEAMVVLLQPILGGAGYVHIDQNLVRLEAVLTNPLVELPEVVRLAWLLSQLQLDLPIHSDSIGSNLLARIAPLAMLPPVLAAAEVMELGRCDEAVVELAIEHWHIPVPKDRDVHSEIAPVMMDWWETYLQTRPNWQMAMQAFAKMLNLQ